MLALCSYLPDEGFATMLDFLGDVLELDPTVPSLQSVLVEYDLNEHDRDHASSVDLDWVLSYVAFQWSNAELELDATVRRAFREVLMATSGTHQSNLLLQMDGFVSAVQQVWPDCVDHDMQHLYMDMMATKRENFRLASERRRKEKLRTAKTTHVASTTVLGIDGVFEEEFVAQVGKVLRYVGSEYK
ncbi:hypothetical protein DYB30_005640 [Aphanomyces astaci]|uniref:Uncharacterized protein n=1 Tax=Aphanomyces astaci TaxID=112090 RepID=A0A397CXC3_APHAT|nr:hypothetical protein DYB34_006584 [Aphanomyces astaci]RHY54851.1 hypothetical protein DYB30_005640 [Aphanomyces astaci]RHY55025.1 hypothetical protein DYB38_004392 [Aphanomyces astaci]